MNDTELDEALNSHAIPDPRENVRVRARRAYAAMGLRARRRMPWFLPRAAGVLTAAGVLVFVMGRAASQNIDVRSLPYTVDSQIIRFAPDGSQDGLLNLTSYMRDGAEIIVSKSKANMFSTMFMSLVSFVHASSIAPAEGTAAAYADCDPNTCSLPFAYQFVQGKSLLPSCTSEGTVVGSEKILGYATTAVRVDRHKRVTLWRAPALGCFPLRVRTESVQPDGAVRLVVEKRASKIAVH